MRVWRRVILNGIKLHIYNGLYGRNILQWSLWWKILHLIMRWCFRKKVIVFSNIVNLCLMKEVSISLCKYSQLLLWSSLFFYCITVHIHLQSQVYQVQYCSVMPVSDKMLMTWWWWLLEDRLSAYSNILPWKLTYTVGSLRDHQLSSSTVYHWKTYILRQHIY